MTDVPDRVRGVIELAVAVVAYLLGKWLVSAWPQSPEWDFLVNWIAPAIPAALVFFFLIPAPRFEVTWHVRGSEHNAGGHLFVDLSHETTSTRAAEITIAATLAVKYWSVLGFILAQVAARRGYWVRVAFRPAGVVALKQQSRAPGASIVGDEDAFAAIRLEVREPEHGKQMTRFAGSLVAQTLQSGRDKVDFAVTIWNPEGRRARLIGKVSSTLAGLDVRS